MPVLEETIVADALPDVVETDQVAAFVVEQPAAHWSSIRRTERGSVRSAPGVPVGLTRANPVTCAVRGEKDKIAVAIRGRNVRTSFNLKPSHRT